MAGPLALVGGAEFTPGNEVHDRLLLAAAGDRPVRILATAAVRHQPDETVETARRWFAGLGRSVEELRVRSRADARSPEVAAAARGSGLLYLAGGDPGLVVEVLEGSAVWDAMLLAWRAGAALAGSSAGAMAMCHWTLLREGWPDPSRRRWASGLGLIPGCAVGPHFDTFGEGWLPSVQASAPAGAILIGIDERSAAVYADGEWRTRGQGAVTVIDGAGRRRFAGDGVIEGIPTPG